MSRKHFIELNGNKKLIETKIKKETVKGIQKSLKDLGNPIAGLDVFYGGGFHTPNGKNHMKHLKNLKEKHEAVLK